MEQAIRMASRLSKEENPIKTTGSWEDVDLFIAPCWLIICADDRCRLNYLNTFVVLNSNPSVHAIQKKSQSPMQQSKPNPTEILQNPQALFLPIYLTCSTLIHPSDNTIRAKKKETKRPLRMQKSI